MAFGGVVQARFFGKMGPDGCRRAALTGMLVWLFGKMPPANGLFDMVQTGLFLPKMLTCGLLATVRGRHLERQKLPGLTVGQLSN